MTFKDFNFKSRLAYSISRAGFEEPSPIQIQSIPLILEGKDMVGQAHTGTGKTAAFALPILQKITKSDGVAAVVIVPTRELATQVADEFYKFLIDLGILTATAIPVVPPGITKVASKLKKVLPNLYPKLNVLAGANCHLVKKSRVNELKLLSKLSTLIV